MKHFLINKRRETILFYIQQNREEPATSYPSPFCFFFSLYNRFFYLLRIHTLIHVTEGLRLHSHFQKAASVRKTVKKF